LLPRQNVPLTAKGTCPFEIVAMVLVNIVTLRYDGCY
jgi:hypothetical protein